MAAADDARRGDREAHRRGPVRRCRRASARPSPRSASAAGPTPRSARCRSDFLADCDTTGGNSGSPTIDGEGRLVGVNFDRVWENVANDFGYNPDVARNVNADVRYLLWMLDEVEGASDLLKELGVGEKVTGIRRRVRGSLVARRGWGLLGMTARPRAPAGG